MTVFLSHPELPADQWIEVDDEALGHHGRAGWLPVDPAAVQARRDEEAAAVARAAAILAGHQPAPADPAPADPPATEPEEQPTSTPQADPSQDAESASEPAPVAAAEPKPTTTASKRSK